MLKWCLVMLVSALLAVAPGVLAKDVKENKVEIANVRYKPAKITIKKGEKVVWVNADERDHTVKAKDKSFDSGKIAAGEKFEFTFKKEGKFEYGCAYHPRMKGVVEVVE
jgi:plastocyanin